MPKVLLLFLLTILALLTPDSYANPAGGPPYGNARIIRHLLRDVEGVTVETQGDQVVVDGTVLSRDEMDRVLRVVDAFPGTLNLVTIHPVVVVDRAKLMQNAIRKTPGCEAVDVDFVNGTYVLTGTVPSSQVKRDAERVVEVYAPELGTSVALQQGILVGPGKRPLVRNLLRVAR